MRSRTAAVIGLALGGVVALAAVRNARSGDEGDMTATAPVDSNRPALDRNLPAKHETATFALG